MLIYIYNQINEALVSIIDLKKKKNIKKNLADPYLFIYFIYKLWKIHINDTYK